MMPSDPGTGEEGTWIRGRLGPRRCRVVLPMEEAVLRG